MVRRMIATITQIESVVTPSGNSGHVVVPKAWIGKEAFVTLKKKRAKLKVNLKSVSLSVTFTISLKVTFVKCLLNSFC
jgi:putative transposon-encoded protein